MLGLNARLQNIGLVNNAKVPHHHVLFIGLVDVRENKARIERGGGGEKNSSEGKNPPPPPANRRLAKTTWRQKLGTRQAGPVTFLAVTSPLHVAVRYGTHKKIYQTSYIQVIVGHL
jgi:hypothetical protein